MIAFLRGIIYGIYNDHVIIDVNGIGYRVFIPNPNHYVVNEERTIYTYHHIREDAQILFGFEKQSEYDLFVRLISVKGVGPKIALGMLGASSVNGIVEAIANNDIKMLKSLPGIGAKSASQIVLDLQGKLVYDESSNDNVKVDSELQDALEALQALGYKANEINSIKKELIALPNLSSDEYIRKALVLLAMKKGV